MVQASPSAQRLFTGVSMHAWAASQIPFVVQAI
jgi:hypothetical protein